MVKSKKFSFRGWSFLAFVKGREKLLIAIIGSVAGWLATQNPAAAGICAAAAELLYAGIKYFVKKY